MNENVTDQRDRFEVVRKRARARERERETGRQLSRGGDGDGEREGMNEMWQRF